MTPNTDANPSSAGTARVFPLAIDGSVFGWASGVDATVEVLDTFRDAGGRMVSTADHYAGGRSEVMIGNWLRKRRVRDSVIVATKIGRHPDAPGLSARSIVEATDASLERLQTDHIDLLSFDGDDPQTPLEESMGAAARLIDSGKVGAIAASGYPGARLREAQSISDARALPRFRAVFSPYNLMQRRPFETEIAPVAEQLELGVFARLPLANGFLAGEYRRRQDVPTPSMFQDAPAHIGRQGFRVLKVLDKIAAETGEAVTTVALAWLRSKPGVIAPVVRAASATHVSQAVRSIELSLEPAQILALDRVSDF